MFDDLLPYYNSELRFMREMARGFAQANPKIAGRLRISSDAVEDPHVGRLIEAFAFLNARTRMKLDDDFPELSESLLDVLYPHYLAPHPSCSVVQFRPQPTLAGHAKVAAGTELLTEPVGGEPVRYRTTHAVELLPIALTAVSLSGPPLPAPRNPRATAAAGVMRLSLACLRPEDTFASLGLERLRLHIHGEANTAHRLYELILGGTVSVALADSAVDEDPVILGPEAVRPAGFAPEEALLPPSPAGDPAYALLSDYFAFPDKFMFFDLEKLGAKTLRDGGRTLEVFLYFDRFDTALERTVGLADLRLFCAPAVNLFSQRADPIRLDPGRYEHRIIPDARRESTTEVFSVDRVAISDRAGTVQPYLPLFSVGRRGVGEAERARYWRAVRRPSTGAEGGDDVFLTTLDPNGRSAADADHVASIDLTCTNRNLPARLPFGDGRPRLVLGAAAGAAAGAVFLSAPTRPIRPAKGFGSLWRVVSHLSLNHLSVSDPKLGLDVVREMLSLYDHQDASASRAVIERLVEVSGAPATARAPAGGRIAFVGGTDLTLEFEDRRLSGSGAYLLGSVLEAVFASLAAVNAFSRTRLRLKGDRKVWRQWPARTGTKPLI